MKTVCLAFFVRRIAPLVALVIIAPTLCLNGISRAIQGADRAVESMSQFLACLPGRIGVRLRAAFFSMVLTQCGSTVFVGFGVLIT